MEDLMQAGVMWEAERNSGEQDAPSSSSSAVVTGKVDDEGIDPASNNNSVEVEHRPAPTSPASKRSAARPNHAASASARFRTPTQSPSRPRPTTPCSPSERSLEGIRGTGRVRLFSAEMHRFFEDDVVNGTGGAAASAVALKEAALTIIGIHRFLSQLSANKLPEHGSVVDHVVKANAIVLDVLQEDRTGRIHEFLIAECGWRGDRFTCEEDYAKLQQRSRTFVAALEQAAAGVAGEAAAAAAAADEAEFFATHGGVPNAGAAASTNIGSIADDERRDAARPLPQRVPALTALSRQPSSGSDGGGGAGGDGGGALTPQSSSTLTDYTPSTLSSPLGSLFNSLVSPTSSMLDSFGSQSPPPFTGGYDSSTDDGPGPGAGASSSSVVDVGGGAAETVSGRARVNGAANGSASPNSVEPSSSSPSSQPAKKKSGESLLNRMWSQAAAAATDWWLCSPGSARGDGPAASAMPKDFEVSFEDIVELEFLGSGALGTVFSGVLDGEKVAIKKFRDAKHVGEEARDLKSLSHPNIVELRGVCAQEPVYCLVMELCLRSVHDVIKGTKIGPELVCNWAKQVACGMEYLHGQNVVHRDLKTPNVLIAADERTLKISDFGTSRQTESKSKATAMTFCGSVAWMAPEMVRSEPCNKMVDVWSFGVVLWELLTGQQPYSGVDTAAILYRIGTGAHHLPVATTTPLAFSLLLKQCWNKEPKHRPKFRQILLHLQIVEEDSGFLETPNEVFFDQQQSWKRENDDQFSKMKIEDDPGAEKAEAVLMKQRERELKHAEDIRQLYEERLGNATQLLVDLRTKMKEVTMSAKQVRRAKSGGKFTVGGGSTKPRRRRKSYSKTEGSSGSGGGGSTLLRSVTGKGKTRDSSPSSSGTSTPREGVVPPPGSKAGKLHRSAERLLKAKLMAIHTVPDPDVNDLDADADARQGSSGGGDSNGGGGGSKGVKKQAAAAAAAAAASVGLAI